MLTLVLPASASNLYSHSDHVFDQLTDHPLIFPPFSANKRSPFGFSRKSHDDKRFDFSLFTFVEINFQRLLYSMRRCF